MKKKWWLFVFTYTTTEGIFSSTSTNDYCVAFEDDPDYLTVKHFGEARQAAGVPSNAVILNIIYLGEATKEDMQGTESKDCASRLYSF